MTTIVETTSLSEQIEDALKAEILAGRYRPGQRISPDELRDRWGVSITPVRDAIRRLESIGLVKVLPRRGVYVATIDKKSFKNIFDLRIALECLAIETAALLIPDEKIEEAYHYYREAERQLRETGDRTLLIERDHTLHDLIIEYCDNPKLQEIMRDLHDLNVWARATLVARHPDSYEQALPEHLEIMEALRARDVEAARQRLRTHLENAFRRAYEDWNGGNGESDSP
ncbi:GntR family transcriptional regulator [Litorilinea aerophila]|uniref:GntR family transcriptional regulator n=1 Tax=Litorilinea aerophila TaxID=1204385 RepID=A0A540VI87_9CHLR|nr:GntR family transcriptional regulator [Litorilinea aerophila]MCC9076039.1 GntR family transcriptional regulator [Litorilinea aerophila]GIV80321.1 MAG: GntR family transcriptional regulator [Litorilinea sp.]